ncbi:hypothetical protein ACWGI0_00445 [Streptomyces sp. NPDC054802]
MATQRAAPPSHVIEGWIILALAVAGLVGAPLVGAVAGKAVLEARSQQRVEHRLTDAVLAENAAPVARGSTRARATVRWTGPEGATHTGRLQVRGGMERGAHVSLWTDKDGAMTSALLGGQARRRRRGRQRTGVCAPQRGSAPGGQRPRPVQVLRLDDMEDIMRTAYYAGSRPLPLA